jgi:hypothetical protein
MSGAKSGGISLAPILMLAGAPVVLAVAGTGYVVVSAVEAYLQARDRIKQEREQAMSEQREYVNQLMDSWKEALAATENAAPGIRVRSVEESLAEMAATSQMAITETAVQELKDYLTDQTTAAPEPMDNRRQGERRRCQDALQSLQEVIGSLSDPLPEEMAARVRDLSEISDAEQLAGQALELRQAINRFLAGERQRCEEQRQQAARMLERLPQECPPQARAGFEQAARGAAPLTEELVTLFRTLDERRQAIEAEQKQANLKNRSLASQVLRETLEEMGYQVGCSGADLFATGSEAFIRNDQWDEGYCVNLRIVKDRIHFKAVKESGGDRDQDASMERAWKGEFDAVTERLQRAGIKIDVTTISEPGETEVMPKTGLPIDTRKKRPAVSTAGEQQYRHQEKQP